MDISTLTRDTALVESGEWVNDPTEDTRGLSVKVRGFSCKGFRSELAEVQRTAPWNERKPDGSLLEDALVKYTARAVQKHILLDWNLTAGEEAAVIPVGGDLALQVLTEPKFEKIANAVVAAAKIVDNARAEATKVLEKNSQTPSAGPSKKARTAA